MDHIISLNQFLWGGPILVLLLGIHLYHTIHLRFVQRKIGGGIRLSLSDDDNNQSHSFSRFGSLTTTLAATLGTGNIVGISTAVFLGGPGAVFWCWLTGIFGMATTYAETYLRTVNSQMNAMFNHAVKFYKLAENPCYRAGTMGKASGEEKNFWTNAEYKAFIQSVANKPESYYGFEIMYWCGLRISELLG